MILWRGGLFCEAGIAGTKIIFAGTTNRFLIVQLIVLDSTTNRP